MKRNVHVTWFAVAAALVALTSVGRAEPPASQPECVTFAGYSLGRASKEIAKGEAIQVNAKGAATAVAGWMAEQSAAGRHHFMSTQIFTNGSVVCAW